MLRFATALLTFLFIAAPASAQCTLTVTTTADAGDGSLRQAIGDANAAADEDVVCFAIPGAGPHTIRPLSALPTITSPLVLDGYTQPGASPNTLAVGSDAVLMIELDGSEAGSSASGLTLGGSADGSIVRGLVINRFLAHGVHINGPSAAPVENVAIEGTFIGTDPTGTEGLGNGNHRTADHGMWISHAIGTRIGGEDSAARNLISGHIGSGILPETGAVGTVIENNYIGTDAAGTAAIPNERGVWLGSGARETTIRGNVISGNARQTIEAGSFGIFLAGVVHPAHTTIQGNLIGVAADGVSPLGNEDHGVTVNSSGHADAPIVIGGAEPGQGNVIAYNGGYGVIFTHGEPSNPILGNAIYENGLLGIDLDGGGPNENDPGDGDGGTNNRQNFPDIVGSAISDDGDLLVTYLVDSDPGHSTYPIRAEFFLAGADGQEGEVFLGFDAYAETDWSGCGSPPCVKTANLGNAASLGLESGAPLLATATDAEDNTSEFSMAAFYVAHEDTGTSRPTEIVLYAPYPNPTRSRTTLAFEFVETGAVRLALYDVLGREVAVLVDEERAAGRYEAVLDGRGLAAGVYLVRLHAGPSVATRRVVLSR